MENRVAGIQREIDERTSEIRGAVAYLTQPEGRKPDNWDLFRKVQSSRWGTELTWIPLHGPSRYPLAGFPDLKLPDCQHPQSLSGRFPAITGHAVALVHAVCDPEPSRHLVGYVSTVIRVGDLVEKAVRAIGAAGVDVTVVDSAAPAESRFLYFHPSRLHKAKPQRSVPAERHHEREVWLAGRSWTLRCDEIAGRSGAFGSSWALVVLLLGAGLSGLATIWYSSHTEHNHRLAQLASQHSGELARARDEAALAVRTKLEFMGRVGHELRTPLNAIIGMSNLLAEAQLPSAQQDICATVNRSARHLSGLLNDLFDLSRIESGSLSMELAAFSVRPLVDEVLLVTREAMAGKSLSTEAQVDEMIPAELTGDCCRLKQILLHLTTRAAKSSVEGSIRIDVRPFSGSGVRQMVRFSVLATGLGPRQDKPGLGLTVSRRLVEAMGGKFGTDGDSGNRLEQWFCVPLEPATSTAGFGSSTLKRIPAQPGLVLLAESSYIHQRIALILLRRCGYQARLASTGTAALDALAQESFSLILLARQLPDADGVDLASRIRRQGILAPIVALAGNLTNADRDECVAGGVDDFLNKPLERTEFEHVLQKWLPGSRASAAQGSGALVECSDSA